MITAITPFNHPLNQVAHKVAPSIATNNRMVLKPTEKMPLSALLLADLLYEAGLPPEMLSVVTGDPREIADELLTNADVDLVTFTGGVADRQVHRGQGRLQAHVLELGGNDPIIVMEDADLDEAATLAVQGSYKNSGQRCTAVKRMLVHEAVADAFVERLVAARRRRAWRLTATRRPRRRHGHRDRRGRGAAVRGARQRRRRAGRAPARRQRARRRALLADRDRPRPARDDVVREETFGPVSPIIRFADIDEAIRIANGTAYGLSSAVCTNRLDHITRFVAELQVGTVNVREVPGYRLELTPFGGIKDSGLGYKEGVQEAMKSFTNIKTYSLPWPESGRLRQMLCTPQPAGRDRAARLGHAHRAHRHAARVRREPAPHPARSFANRFRAARRRPRRHQPRAVEHRHLPDRRLVRRQGPVTHRAALAVMLGADVGTALMAVVFSFDLSWLSPLLIFVGVVLFISRQNSGVGRFGRVLIGLGLITARAAADRRAPPGR